MDQLQWQKDKPDVPGLWLWKDEYSRVGAVAISEDNIKSSGFTRDVLWAGPLNIAPPDPELRLPDGWTSLMRASLCGWRLDVFFPDESDAIHVCGKTKAIVIRAAQAAVDVLTGGE